jgi:hypothetical protein
VQDVVFAFERRLYERAGLKPDTWISEAENEEPEQTPPDRLVSITSTRPADYSREAFESAREAALQGLRADMEREASRLVAERITALVNEKNAQSLRVGTDHYERGRYDGLEHAVATLIGREPIPSFSAGAEKPNPLAGLTEEQGSGL